MARHLGEQAEHRVSHGGWIDDQMEVAAMQLANGPAALLFPDQ